MNPLPPPPSHARPQTAPQAQGERLDAYEGRPVEERVSALQALAAIGEQINRATTLDAVLDAVVGGVHEALATDTATLLLLDEDDGCLRVLASRGISAADAASERVPLGAGIAGRIAARREAMIVADVAAAEPASAWIRRELRALAGVPLVIQDRVVGVLHVGSRQPRDFTAEDVALLQLVAARAASAVVRARLYEAERAARRRAELLQRLGAALAPTLQRAQVAEVILRHMVEALGAASAGVLELSADGAHFVTLGLLGVGEDVQRKYARVPVTAALPVREVAARREAAYVHDVREWLARYPVAPSIHGADGDGAWAALPLLAGDALLGALTLAFTAPRAFAREERDFLQAFAHFSAQALDRARAYEGERAAREAAERADRVKMEFLATMSHELRTPLNAIGGHAQLLELGIYGDVNPKQREALGRIQSSQAHLLGLINDVLNFARLESGRVEYHLAEVALCDVTSHVASLMEAQFRGKGVRFTCEPADPSLRVLVDEEKLRQVLLNLLSNALKFTAPGGAVWLRCLDRAPRAVVEVEDTGVGIDPAKLEQVFEPFVQLGRSHATAHEGTGLGLAISRDLARGMGGDLTARSLPGSGSTFVLAVPQVPQLPQG